MNEPIAKARWVLETRGTTGVPAQQLHDIARQEDIRFIYRPLPNEPTLGGQLLYRGNKKGIIINTLIDNHGRHNFTFAHELGHYFLKHSASYTLDGESGFWCSISDIGDGTQPKEIEANRFAAELLMPEVLFRLDMAGAPIDFVLIASLANKYMVSKHAVSNRVLELTREPCIIITSTGSVIDTTKASRAARSYLGQMKHIPKGSIADSVISDNKRQNDFLECDPQKWLTRRHTSGKLYSCTHGSNNHFMTILRW